MAKNIHNLIDPVMADPERAADVEAGMQEALAELALYELRQRSDVTQVEMASLLEVTQGTISQLENRDDALVSTLSDYLEALGAELRLTAVFDTGAEIPVHLGR